MKGYVVKIEKDGDGFVASFPDVPAALTGGDDMAEVLHAAADALRSAIVGYMDQRQPVPVATTKPRGADIVITLPEEIQIKALLWNAMLDAGVNKSALAKKLKKSEGYVRKLLDPYHNSTIDSLTEAARALDKRIDMALADLGPHERVAASAPARSRAAG